MNPKNLNPQKSKSDLINKSFQDKDQIITEEDSSEKIADAGDAKLINKKFKNVHTKPADEQEFENNI